jgi:anionic cell wall polymer biosynthesis LytR-Cps2A-Psr (LCP) family protein
MQIKREEQGEQGEQSEEDNDHNLSSPSEIFTLPSRGVSELLAKVGQQIYREDEQQIRQEIDQEIDQETDQETDQEFSQDVSLSSKTRRRR